MVREPASASAAPVVNVEDLAPTEGFVASVVEQMRAGHPAAWTVLDEEYQGYSRDFVRSEAFVELVLAQLRAGRVVEWVEEERDHGSRYVSYLGVGWTAEAGYFAWGGLDDAPVRPPVESVTEAALRKRIKARPWNYRDAAYDLLAVAMSAALDARDWARLRALADDLSVVRFPDSTRALWGPWAAFMEGDAKAMDLDGPGPEGMLGLNVCVMARALWPEGDRAARWSEAALGALCEVRPKDAELAAWRAALRGRLGLADAAPAPLERAMIAHVYAPGALRGMEHRALRRRALEYARARLREVIERGAWGEVKKWAARFAGESSADRVLPLWADVAGVLDGGKSYARFEKIRAERATALGLCVSLMALVLWLDAVAAARHAGVVARLLLRKYPSQTQLLSWLAAMEQRAGLAALSEGLAGLDASAERAAIEAAAASLARWDAGFDVTDSYVRARARAALAQGGPRALRSYAKAERCFREPHGGDELMQGCAALHEGDSAAAKKSLRRFAAKGDLGVAVSALVRAVWDEDPAGAAWGEALCADLAGLLPERGELSYWRAGYLWTLGRDDEALAALTRALASGTAEEFQQYLASSAHDALRAEHARRSAEEATKNSLKKRR